MPKDKYTATWVSYSSMSDYLKCPRAYFLKNVYRDPKTGHKISLMQPALALGQVVHSVVESLSTVPAEQRFNLSLLEQFDTRWKRVHGIKGGFRDSEDEERIKSRGKAMIMRLIDHPGPLMKKAIKIRQELPYYWLDEEENIILCGKIDWLIYDEERDSVTILDFKTGKYDEDPDSLQLPIYHLLVSHCQSRPIIGAMYWYLERDEEPTDVVLPSLEDAQKRVMDIAKRIQLARKLERFVCVKKDGCAFCTPLEAIVSNNAEHVGVNEYNQDVYIAKNI